MNLPLSRTVEFMAFLWALCKVGVIHKFQLPRARNTKSVTKLDSNKKSSGKENMHFPTRCTNFSNLCLEWNSACFGQFLCPSSGVFHCTQRSGICHTGLLTVCEQDQDGTAVPAWSCSQTVSKPVRHLPMLCVQWKTPDDGHRKCPKHVEFHSNNKLEKLVHLVGFIIRN
jgi:hypothetical protein